MRRLTRSCGAFLIALVAAGVLHVAPAAAAPAQAEPEPLPVTTEPVELYYDPAEPPAPPVLPEDYGDGDPEARGALTTGGVEIIYDPENPFPAAAQAAFSHAADLVAAFIDSPVPIVVRASWRDLGSPNLLGSAGPALHFARQPGLEELPLEDTAYPIGLVNSYRGSDLCPAVSTPSYCSGVSWDINAEFNSAFANWYFGTDASPGSQLDFVSVVLHELVHGVGYVAGFSRSGIGVGSYPDTPLIYARYVVNGSGQNLTDTGEFANPSFALGNQLVGGGGGLRWSGASGIAGAGGTQPVLYAPSSWAAGSSVSHLDESTYPSGNPNALMTPTIGSGQAVHDPGPISRGILTDLGWTIASPSNGAEAPADFDGDGTTDIAVFRPSSGMWLVQGAAPVQFGSNGDVPVPGQWDADPELDIALFRPSTARWYFQGQASVQYGSSGDIPIPGQWDADPAWDIAVFRPSSGMWLVQGAAPVQFGSNGDVPVPGQWDADPELDIALFRPSTARWYFQGQASVQYGSSGDTPITSVNTLNAVP